MDSTLSDGMLHSLATATYLLGELRTLLPPSLYFA